MTLGPLVRRILSLVLTGAPFVSPRPLAAQDGALAPAYRVKLLAPLPGLPSAEAKALNNRGQASGDSGLSGVLWDHGSLIEIQPFPGYTGISVRDMNLHGHVVGAAPDYDYTAFPTAFLFRNGELIDLFPGLLEAGGHAEAVAINDAGLIGGNVVFLEILPPITKIERAFVWSNGATTLIEPLVGEDESEAIDVNNRGQVLCRSGNRAFFWEDGVVIELGPLGMSLRDLNDAGQIAGATLANDGYVHAALYDDGSIVDLGTLEGHSGGRALNNLGHVVGLAEIKGIDWPPHAALWKDGAVFDLHAMVEDQIDGVLISASGINDAGQIIATAWREPYIWIAYLLTPVNLGDADGDGAADLRSVVLRDPPW